MTKEQFLTTIYQNEDQFTAATYRYINANYPHLRHFFFHIPNESATNDVIRLKLHAMGVLTGVHDFRFELPSPGWYLELKMPNGTISPKQKALNQLWATKGIIIETAYNAQEVLDILKKRLT